MRPTRVIAALIIVLALGACSDSGKGSFTGLQAKMTAATRDIKDPVLRSLPKDGAMGLGR